MRQPSHAPRPKNTHGKRIHTGQETNTHRLIGMTNAGVQPRTLVRHLTRWPIFWLEHLTRKKKRGVQRVGKEKKMREKKKRRRKRRRNKKEVEKEKRN